MPTTYNGIGTHYYGKKNLQKRPGACRSCGRTVELASYDTRLWFVVVFIPLIPLGRKRILDFCPSCKRHYVSDLEKWETARQLEVSGALEKFRSNPTPEGAIAVHQQMLGFHQVAEAAAFEKTMVAQFPDHAKIHAYLGAALEHLGQRDQAVEYYQRALTLRPDLPEARIGVARGNIRGGQLDEARKQLDFLEKPGAAQLYPLEPLETLARAYQSAGRHREALELFGKLLEALPKIAEHKGFRDTVKKSEKALGGAETILPKLKFSWKRLFQATGQTAGRPYANARRLLVLGVILAVVALGFVIANEYIRHHRTLYLVNAYAQPATVKISGAGGVEKFKGTRTLALPEGRFHAVISGPVEQELDFEVRDGYFDRWFGNPLWLINVGGGALLEEKVAAYSQNPQPPAISFRFGQPFERFAEVTHPFTPLPASVQIQSGETRTLIQLELFKGEAADVFNYHLEKRGAGEALNFAEGWLQAHPDDKPMLRLYAASAEQQKQSARLDNFLRAGFTNRPVRVEWNRLYQNLHDHPGERTALLLQYDDLLQAEPANSSLLYLRGRLEANRVAARSYYKRATEADPANPFPIFALGYDRLSAGDWTGARPLLARAVELDAHDAGFINWLFITRLALGEAQTAEKELQKKLASDPLNYLTEFQLIDALAAQDKPDAVMKAADSFIKLCRTRYGSRGEMLISAVQYRACYAAGEFEKLKSVATNDQSAAGRTMLAVALIELGQVDEAVKNLPAEMNAEEKQFFMSAIAVAYRQSGNEAAARQWQSRAIEGLQAGNEDFNQAAALLLRSTLPTRSEWENVAIPPQLKTVMLAGLCQQSPQARTELAGFARELNVERMFPFYLVRRVIAPVP